MRSGTPSNVGYVGWCGTRVDRPGTTQTVDLVYLCTYLYTARREAGEDTRVRFATHPNPGALWARVRQELDPSRPLWIFCWDAPSWLTVSGFWELLEDEEFTVEPIKKRGSVGAKSGRKKRSGIVTLEGPPYFFFCHHPRGELRVVDARNYWRGPAEEALGVAEHHPRPAELSGSTAQALDAIAERQATAVRERMEGLFRAWEANPAGNWKPTLPGLAWASYEAFGGPGKPTPHHDGQTKEHERLGYYGGRQWAGWIGRILDMADGPPPEGGKKTRKQTACQYGPVAELDVRGLYAWIMRERLFPQRLIGTYKSLSPGALAGIASVHGAISTVLVETTDRPYPLRWEDRTLYPVGRYWTTLAGEELAYALQAGHIQSVGYTSVYALGQPFRVWCDHWMQVRANADSAGEVSTSRLAKLVLNSLYGRFAMWSPKWQLAPGVWCPEPWTSWVTGGRAGERSRSFHSLGWEVWELTGRQERERSFPAVAAFITAAARERMRELVGAAGERHCLYSHTDSLICTVEGVDALTAAGHISSGEYGKLQLKGWHLEGAIRGPGDYELSGVPVISGLPRQARSDDGRAYRGEHWPGVQQMLAQRPDGRIGIALVDFNLPLMHAGGWVDESGYVHPFVMDTLANS